MNLTYYKNNIYVFKKAYIIIIYGDVRKSKDIYFYKKV